MYPLIVRCRLVRGRFDLDRLFLPHGLGRVEQALKIALGDLRHDPRFDRIEIVDAIGEMRVGDAQAAGARAYVSLSVQRCGAGQFLLGGLRRAGGGEVPELEGGVRLNERIVELGAGERRGAVRLDRFRKAIQCAPRVADGEPRARFSSGVAGLVPQRLRALAVLQRNGVIGQLGLEGAELFQRIGRRGGIDALLQARSDLVHQCARAACVTVVHQPLCLLDQRADVAGI